MAAYSPSAARVGIRYSVRGALLVLSPADRAGAGPLPQYADPVLSKLATRYFAFRTLYTFPPMGSRL